MVDDINDVSSSIINVGGELTAGITDDIRGEGGDGEMMSQYSVSMLMPLSDVNLLPPTTGDTTEPPLSSTETQSQVIGNCIYVITWDTYIS